MRAINFNKTSLQSETFKGRGILKLVEEKKLEERRETIFSSKNEVIYRIEDEMSADQVKRISNTSAELVIKVVAGELSWSEVGDYFQSELTHLRDLHEKLAKSSQKCDLVKGKLAAALKEGSPKAETRAAACWMLLEETKMHRDHFDERARSIELGLLKRIVSNLEDFFQRGVPFEVEIRLRAEFSKV